MSLSSWSRVWMIFALGWMTTMGTGPTCCARKVGDVVDTDIGVVQSGTTADALRSQMPVFGFRTSATFSVEDDDTIFALRFDDGLWAVSSRLDSKDERLIKTVVKFVYSGAGSIHTVSSIPVYGVPSKKNNVLVEYEWIEEASANIESGQTAMFLVVTIACVVILFVSCGGVIDEKHVGSMTKGAQGNGLAVPKWD